MNAVERLREAQEVERRCADDHRAAYMHEQRARATTDLAIIALTNARLAVRRCEEAVEREALT